MFNTNIKRLTLYKIGMISKRIKSLERKENVYESMGVHQNSAENHYEGKHKDNG